MREQDSAIVSTAQHIPVLPHWHRERHLFPTDVLNNRELRLTLTRQHALGNAWRSLAPGASVAGAEIAHGGELAAAASCSFPAAEL